MIVVRHQRESAANQLQTVSGRVIVQLAFDVCCLHDAGHLQQCRILTQPLTHQRCKGAKALRILVRISCAGSIKAPRAASACIDATWSAGTKRNSAFGSRNRRMSQQVAVRLTRIP